MRGNPILGKVRGGGGEEGDRSQLATDMAGHPYTTLSYANGPGYTGASNAQPAGPKTFPHDPSSSELAAGRPDLTHVDTEAPSYLQESLVPTKSESHGGEDVGIWATGPGSAAFRGTLEENVIYHVIVQATRGCASAYARRAPAMPPACRWSCPGRPRSRRRTGAEMQAGVRRQTGGRARRDGRIDAWRLAVAGAPSAQALARRIIGAGLGKADAQCLPARRRRASACQQRVDCTSRSLRSVRHR